MVSLSEQAAESRASALLHFAVAAPSLSVERSALGVERSVRMLRCLSSLGCPDASLDAVLALAARHDLTCVELRALGGTIDLAGHFAEKFGTPARLAERLRGEAVRVVALNASLKLIDGTDAEREQLAALAPWAEAVGARWLRVFDGGKNADAAELADAADTLAWWRALRRVHGWQCDVMIETHDSLLTAAAIQRFTAACPGTAILWDAHHTWKKGGEDPVATWRAIRAGVVHVHVKDSVPVPSARHPFTYVLPGDGGFPIAPLLAALRADHFSGAVSLEWEKQWHPYLPPLEEALRTAAERGWW
jgi:sugar phosphate isomerase/epimerase